MSKNVTKFITPRVVCTNIPNRVLSWFDFFTAYYNCLNKNVRKLISPRVLCASVTNRVLSWFDFFSVITTVWAKMSENSYLREFCAQVSQIVFLADLTVLRTISTEFLHKSPKSCSYFDRFTSFYNCMKKMSQNSSKMSPKRLNHMSCHQTHISASTVHKCHKTCS